MSRDDRNHWEEKHGAAGKAAGDTPAAFLVENASLLVPGVTLDLACGSGRNATFLAGLGHRVAAIDGARSALEAVAARGIDALRVQMDLDHPGIRPCSLDNVVCVSFLDRRLFPEFVRWLRPGGVLLYDTFLVDQREIGHPRNPDYLLGRNELLRLVAGMRVLRYREGPVEERGTLSHRAGIVAVNE